MELRTCTVFSMFSAVHPVAAMSLKRLRALALLVTIFSFALAAIAQSVSFAGVASTVGSGSIPIRRGSGRQGRRLRRRQRRQICERGRGSEWPGIVYLDHGYDQERVQQRQRRCGGRKWRCLRNGRGRSQGDCGRRRASFCSLLLSW